MIAFIKSCCFSFIILASFATLFAVADSRRYNVGGNGVWVINPHESYKTWAERNRFQVNDTLYFKYVKGSDSVQQVMKADFDGCNIRNPLKNFDNGESVVTLDRSGPFYFISGNEDHCKKGQKLIVVVLTVRNHPTVPISPAKPPVVQPPKSPSPVSPIAPVTPPSKSQPPKSSSPASPISPATSPSKPLPPKSSSPLSHPPAASPSHSSAKSPATPSPPPKSPSPASSPSPSAPSAPSTDQSPRSSPAPSESTPTSHNFTAPAPSPKNAANGVDVASVMTTVLSLAFTVLMFV